MSEMEPLPKSTILVCLSTSCIFNAMIALVELGEAAGIPYSEQQQMSILYTIFNKSGQFCHDIIAWNHRPAVKKNIINFKVHFHSAHDEHHETSNATLEILQQANIARQVIEGIEHLLLNPEDAQPAAIDPVEKQALSAQQGSDLLPSLLQTITSMQNIMMLTMQNDMQRRCPQHGGGQGRGRGNDRGSRGGRGTRNPTYHTHYCWTHHGICRHSGSVCNVPVTGHCNKATVTNQLGGSTRNVA